MLPSYDEWSDLVKVSYTRGTDEWKALDAAYKDYSIKPDAQSSRERLVAALNSFDEKKKQKHGGVRSARDAKGALTALRRHLLQKPVELTTADLAALDEMGWAQRNSIFRTLVGARIRYKQNTLIEMGMELKGGAEDFVTKLKEIPGVSGSSSAEQISSTAGHEASSLWQGTLQSITGMAGELQGEVMDALTREVGAHTMSAIASAVPILGTVKDGLDVLKNLKNIVNNELVKNRINDSRVYTRPGDVQIAINNIQRILSGRRVELGIELAGSVTGFTTGVVSMGMAAPIASAAQSGVKLIYTIYNFVSDHFAMTRANKLIDEALRSRRLLIDIMNDFPLLGAHLITLIEASTLLEFSVLEIGDPFFMILIEYYRSKCDTLKDTARSIVTESRFEIVTIQLPDAALLQTHNRLKHDLQKNLEIAFEARERAARDFADHKKKMGSVFEEMKARQAAKEKATQVMEQLQQQATMLELMVLVNEENEREAARLIDIRAMRETQQQDLARLQALQQRVKKAITTYHDQTSGFSGMFTRQSSESTAATQALKPLSESKNPEDLKKLESLVKYLLKKPGATSSPINTVTQPLKQPSRLYDMLNPVYS